MGFADRFLSIKRTSNYNVIGEAVEYKVIVDDEAKEVILRWEESKENKDWQHNFMFIPWILKLPYTNKKVLTTHGYACAYKSTLGLPVAEFIAKTKEYPFYRKVIDGWSFGSAMAKISARHYAYVTKELVDGVYTYGDVKCWFNPFIRFNYQKWTREAKEFCCANDIVTWCVPFYHRQNKCPVGGRFSIKKVIHPEIWHQFYEDYDYRKYEK